MNTPELPDFDIKSFVGDIQRCVEHLKSQGSTPNRLIVNPSLMVEPYRTPFLERCREMGIEVEIIELPQAQQSEWGLWRAFYERTHPDITTCPACHAIMRNGRCICDSKDYSGI